jgi:hypothetical protein
MNRNFGVRKVRTYELPSNDEGSGVPAEEIPDGVFEDIIDVFEAPDPMLGASSKGEGRQ